MPSLAWFRFFFTIFPAALILYTSGQAVFGDQGIFALEHAKSQLGYVENKVDEGEVVNRALRLKVERLKNRRQIILLAADRLLSAPEGTQVFRFSEGP